MRNKRRLPAAHWAVPGQLLPPHRPHAPGGGATNATPATSCSRRLPDAAAWRTAEATCPLALPPPALLQIRVHLAHAGHPILGDDLYGLIGPWIPRQALHAVRFSPNGGGGGSGGGAARWLAYGGAAGFLRLHRVCFDEPV